METDGPLRRETESESERKHGAVVVQAVSDSPLLDPAASPQDSLASTCPSRAPSLLKSAAFSSAPLPEPAASPFGKKRDEAGSNDEPTRSEDSDSDRDPPVGDASRSDRGVTRGDDAASESGPLWGAGAGSGNGSGGGAAFGPGGMGPGGRRRRDKWSMRKRFVVWCSVSMAGVIVLGASSFTLVWSHLNGNIRTEWANLKPSAMGGKQDVLFIGSDSRAGANKALGGGGVAGARSDTTMVFDSPADRRKGTEVSIPRDSMVQIPDCTSANGQTVSATFGMFNSAFTSGGAPCTVRTVQSLTGLALTHYIVVDFEGVVGVVNALGGVKVCVTRAINDRDSGLNLPAGTTTLNGQQALAFVRVRHAVGDGSDLERIQRQQYFIDQLSSQVRAAGLLTDPVKLYKVLNAATSALQTDPGLGSVSELYGLAQTLNSIPSGKMTYVTVPNEPFPDNPDRVVWSEPAATKLWDSLINEPDSATATSGSTALGLRPGIGGLTVADEGLGVPGIGVPGVELGVSGPNSRGGVRATGTGTGTGTAADAAAPVGIGTSIVAGNGTAADAPAGSGAGSSGRAPLDPVARTAVPGPVYGPMPVPLPTSAPAATFGPDSTPIRVGQAMSAVEAFLGDGPASVSGGTSSATVAGVGGQPAPGATGPLVAADEVRAAESLGAFEGLMRLALMADTPSDTASAADQSGASGASGAAGSSGASGMPSDASAGSVSGTTTPGGVDTCPVN